eukprot:g7443.t1
MTTTTSTTRVARLREKQPLPSDRPWIDLGISRDDLRLEHTLPIGQTFAWTEITPGSVPGAAGGPGGGVVVNMGSTGGSSSSSSSSSAGGSASFAGATTSASSKNAKAGLFSSTAEAEGAPCHQSWCRQWTGVISAYDLANSRIGESAKTIGHLALVLESRPETTRVKVLGFQGIEKDKQRTLVLQQPAAATTDAANSPENQVRHYFRLSSSGSSFDLPDLYRSWSSACPWFRRVAKQLPGVRLLRQNLFETMVCFLVSQNNNVQRIAQILGRIRRKYGREIAPGPCACRGEDGDVLTFSTTAQGSAGIYSFPTVEEFVAANVTEQELRELGLGYRAKYLSAILGHLKRIYGGASKTAAAKPSSEPTKPKNLNAAKVPKPVSAMKLAPTAKVQKSAMKAAKQAKHRPAKPKAVQKTTAKKKPTAPRRQKEAELPTLPLEEYWTLSKTAVVEELMRYPGIGHKVADCIALFAVSEGCTCMSLVPVDTHVWTIAKERGYLEEEAKKKKPPAKGLTPTRYEEIQTAFATRFGDYAGWAHCVLFAAELPAFRRLFGYGG